MNRILVTGAGGTGVGASILHALKQAEYPWETFAADADPFSWGLYTADDAAVVPLSDDPCYLHCIQDLIWQHRISAVIPGTPAETAFLAEHGNELDVPLIANRAELMPFMRDKRLAMAKLRELGVRHAPSYPWKHRGDALMDFGFPLVIKPSQNTSGSRGLFLITGMDELEALTPLITPHSDVQPYIGDADHEYSVTVLSGTRGEIFGSFVFRRQLTGFSLHTAREFEGKRIAVSTGFSQGHVIHDQKIQGFAEELSRILDSRGPLDIQLRLVNGEPVIFEYQPRFSFSTAFRATAGFNEPDILLRHQLLGEDFPRVDYREGVVIRAFDHVFVPADKMLKGY